MTRIALIHATVVSMDPTETAFSDLWPEAETFHLLDSSLSTDRAKAGELTDDLSQRIIGMAEYAAERGREVAVGDVLRRVVASRFERATSHILKPFSVIFSGSGGCGGKSRTSEQNINNQGVESGKLRCFSRGTSEIPCLPARVSKEQGSEAGGAPMHAKPVRVCTQSAPPSPTERDRGHPRGQGRPRGASDSHPRHA